MKISYSFAEIATILFERTVSKLPVKGIEYSCRTSVVFNKDGAVDSMEVTCTDEHKEA